MLKDALIINLFWTSLPIIGYALLLTVSNFPKWRYGNRVAKIVLRQHLFTITIASLAISFFIFSLLSLVLYPFNLSVFIPSALYCVLLLYTLLYLLQYYGRKLFTTRSFDPFQLKGQIFIAKLLFFIAVVILIGDFFLTIFIAKAFPWGDGVFHMARVVNILNDGFNIQSSFFSNLPEGGYLYNVVYILYSIPAYLFSLEPMKIWEYSLGFFRLMFWLSVFMLSQVLFKEWLKEKTNWLIFSSLSLISAICIFSSQLFTANYPNRIVVIWITMMIICLSYSNKVTIRIVNPIIIALSFLIATTHTIYALVTACFLAGFFIIKLIVFGKKNITKGIIASTGLAIAILLIGPLVAKLMPVRTSKNLINLVEAPTTDFFGMHFLTPDIPKDLFGWVILLISLVALALMFNILWKRGLKHQGIIFLSTLLFYPIIVFTPPIFSSFNMFLPIWIIQRFSAISIFSFLTIGIAAYVFYYYTSRYNFSNIEKHQHKIIMTAIILLTLLYSGYSGIIAYKALVKDRMDKNQTYQIFDETTHSFKPFLDSNKVVISKPTPSYYINALFNIDILAVEYGHSPLASDGENRELCQEHIMNTLEYSDLKSVKAAYILISPYEDMKNTRLIAENKPYLRLVKTNSHYLLYEFVTNRGRESINTYKPCLNFQISERS